MLLTHLEVPPRPWKEGAKAGEWGPRPPSIVLYSGGLDTYLILRGLLPWYEGQEDRIHAIPIFYSQRNVREIFMARRVCEKYGVSMYSPDPSGWLHLPPVANSKMALIDNYTATEEELKSQKATNVPNRNVIFIAYAAAYAEIIGADTIYYGAELEPMRAGTSRPDCTVEVYLLLQQLCLSSLYKPVHLRAPYGMRGKKELLRAAYDSGLGPDDFSETYTCYSGTWPPCGRCRSCLKRAEAFHEAGMVDATYEGVEDPANGMAQEV